MAKDHECAECGKAFSTKRGLGVHKAQMHGDAEKKKEELLILQMIDKGKQKITDLADELGWDESRIKKRLDTLIEKDYVQEKMEQGREAMYKLTEEGRKRIVPLLKDIVDETKKFAEGVKESFKEHIGSALPRIEVKWPEDED